MELEEFEEYIHDREIEENLFKRLLTAPREAFRFITQNQYEKHLVQLLVLAGITSGLDKAIEETPRGVPGMTSAILLMVLGGIFGWIGYYIFSGVLSVTGRWLKGKGKTDIILPVLAYASFPTIASSLFIVIRILIQTNGDLDTPTTMIYYASLFCEIALSIWSLILLTIGLAEAHQFSIGKAILNILLPIAIIFVPILIYILSSTTTS